MSRILLVNDHLTGGIGRYALHLYRGLRRLPQPGCTFDLLLQNLPRTAALAEWEAGVGGANGSTLILQPRPAWVKQTGYGYGYQLTSYFYFPRRVPQGYSLYHVSSQMMGNTVGSIRPAVVTCHDTVALQFPRNHPWFATAMRIRHLRALPRAAAIIFISEFSRSSFLARFSDYPEERTFCVPHGATPGFAPGDRAASRVLAGLPANRPIILHVGSEERRKNIETLLRVVRILADHIPDVLLLRVGGQSTRARRLVSSLRLDGHVRYVRSVPDAALAHLYVAADALVFPSIIEGFGLPALEALQSGCPVIAANASSIPDIVGDAGVLLDPMDVAGFAAAVERVLRDVRLREDLVRRGLARVAQFTWENAARQTAHVYQRVLGM